MKQPSITEIISVMKSNDFVVFDKPFDVNLGAIRTKDNKSNKFNDFAFAFCDNGRGSLLYYIIPATTDAGLYYRKNPINKKGTAIIQHDKQYRGVYQLQDPTKDKRLRGHRGQKAFKQIKQMQYWRDINMDEYLDFTGKTYKQNAATNGHYMGTLGKNVDKWSAGCWGSTISNMNKLYRIAEFQINHGLGDKFSFTLLHENSFK